MATTRTRRTLTAAVIAWAAMMVGPAGLASAAAGGHDSCPASLTWGIPPRPKAAPVGADFAASVARDDARAREYRIEDELLRGNLPAFLRRLQPVVLEAAIPGGRVVTATICVTPDYLSIGADRDFLRIPMNLRTATEVATRFGFVLPTRRMVDAIYLQSAAHLRPQPMQAGPEMRSTDYYVRHDESIRAQRSALGIPLGVLVSGHKKDVVLSNRLASHPGRIAIYGWHELDGRPIQPLSTVHGAGYADYSHGVRLVSDVVFVDDVPASLHDVLQDRRLAGLLSDEGPVELLPALIPEEPTLLARLGFVRPGASRRTGDAQILQFPPF